MMYPTALVTGGSRGIGKAIVQQLFEQGYNVAINYFRSETCAVELAAELNKHSLGNKAIAICADVSNASQVKIMFEETFGHCFIAGKQYRNFTTEVIFRHYRSRMGHDVFSKCKEHVLMLPAGIDGYDSQQKRKNHQYFFYVGTSRSILRSPLLRL